MNLAGNNSDPTKYFILSKERVAVLHGQILYRIKNVPNRKVDTAVK